MQDRFEKEVHSKMEELKLTPSAPVWEKIELEIRPEKKRRRVIFWFLLAGLFLSGSAWWLYQSFDNDHRQASSEDSINNSQNRPNNQKPASKRPAETTNTSIIYQRQPAVETKAHEDNSPSEKKVITSKTIQQELKQIVKKSNEGIDNKKSSSTITLLTNPGTLTKENLPAKNSSETKTPVNDQLTPVTNTTNNTEILSSKPSVNDSVAKPLIEKGKTPESVTIDSSIKKKVAINKKWNRQINLTLGRSTYASGLSLLKSAAMQDAFASAGGGTGSTPGGLANNSFAPASTVSGFGFSIGFSLSKKLNDHWEASFGLQYTQLTTETKVGDKRSMDTAVRYSADRINVDEFYTNTGKNNYTNRFHVLEVPVNISYRPAIKLPLYISTGISYGRLISSNALTFSNTSNIYYKNDENYVRNLLPVQASVQYRFRDKRKVSIQTGPVVQYNLLKFQKESTDEKTHLLFAGLKTIVNF